MYGIEFSLENTIEKMFIMLDVDSDGFINYFDFATLMQASYVFSKHDKFLKGRIPASLCREYFAEWSDYPAISYKIRDRAKRLSYLETAGMTSFTQIVCLLLKKRSF